MFSREATSTKYLLVKEHYCAISAVSVSFINVKLKISENYPRHKNAYVFTNALIFSDSVSEVPEELRPDRLVKFDDIFVISAKEKQGTEEMKQKLRHLLDIYAEQHNGDLALQMKETEIMIEKSKEHRKVRLI